MTTDANLYIPGFMPLTPRGPEPVQADPLGGINVVIHTTEGTTSDSAFKITVKTIEGRTLLNDPHGERIFFLPLDQGGEYRFITNSEKDFLPEGISKLHVLINNKIEKTFHINVPSTEFQIAKNKKISQTGITLSGKVKIQEGVTALLVEFCPQFLTRPGVALVQVIGDPALPDAPAIVATIVQLHEDRMEIRLSSAPSTDNYQLAWVAWF